MTEAQRNLVKKNHNLIYSFLQKHKLSIEDYYDVAAIGLCKAAITYNPQKASFSTYAYKCMLASVLIEKRKDNAKGKIPLSKIFSYDTKMELKDENISFLEILPSKYNVEKSVIIKMDLENTKSMSLRDREITKMFALGYSQKEIAKIMNLTQASVSRIKKKILQKLQ